MLSAAAEVFVVARRAECLAAGQTDDEVAGLDGAEWAGVGPLWDLDRDILLAHEYLLPFRGFGC